jgi:hypothetical protein
MPTVTAPYVETQQVVTGFMYQLHIGEEDNGPGITRLDIGPYFFSGTPPQIKYPEAVTNEMCPPGWQAVRWYTDEAGASWLRWQGGRLLAEDGEAIFQLTSNYPAINTDAALSVWHGNSKSADRYAISAPDYTQSPPQINPRHDILGQKQFAQGKGCAPFVLMAGTLAGLLLRHWIA